MTGLTHTMACIAALPTEKELISKGLKRVGGSNRDRRLARKHARQIPNASERGDSKFAVRAARAEERRLAHEGKLRRKQPEPQPPTT